MAHLRHGKLTEVIGILAGGESRIRKACVFAFIFGRSEHQRCLRHHKEEAHRQASPSLSALHAPVHDSSLTLSRHAARRGLRGCFPGSRLPCL
eukprot:200216-Rhodomonas_salina.8